MIFHFIKYQESSNYGDVLHFFLMKLYVFMDSDCCVKTVYQCVASSRGFFSIKYYKYFGRGDCQHMVRTLHSFHQVQAAVRKEECDGYRRSGSVLAC
jgi:hypothetical protein